MPENVLRHLPSIDQLLRRDGLRDLITTAGRDAVRDRLREVLAEIRGEIVNKPGIEDRGTRMEDRLKRNDAIFDPRSSILGLSEEELAGEIERRLNARSPPPVESRVQPTLDLARKLLLRKTEDRGSRIEDRVIALKAILHPRSSILDPRFVDDLPSDFGEDFAQTVSHRVAPGRCDQISQAVAAQQLVNRRQMT